jgi:hypothetical protein
MHKTEFPTELQTEFEKNGVANGVSDGYLASKSDGTTSIGRVRLNPRSAFGDPPRGEAGEG